MVGLQGWVDLQNWGRSIVTIGEGAVVWEVYDNMDVSWTATSNAMTSMLTLKCINIQKILLCHVMRLKKWKRTKHASEKWHDARHKVYDLSYQSINILFDQ